MPNDSYGPVAPGLTLRVQRRNEQFYDRSRTSTSNLRVADANYRSNFVASSAEVTRRIQALKRAVILAGRQGEFTSSEKSALNNAEFLLRQADSLAANGSVEAADTKFNEAAALLDGAGLSEIG